MKGKRIERAQPDLEDRIAYDRASPAQFKQAIEGARVVGSGRKGKYFWLELDRRPWPVFHLGMTGHVEIRKRGGGKFAKVWGDRKMAGKRLARPKGELAASILPFCRLRLVMSDGTEVAITDARRFGRIRLAQDPSAEAPISKLGFDPLDRGFPSARELGLLLAKRRAPLKAVLLDQGLFAGVGNWIADEVLYQALLSPHRLASKLTAAEVSRLRTKLLGVIRLAVRVHADYERFPANWMFHQRWGKGTKQNRIGHHPIVHDTVGGRTTAWVPALQK